LFVSPAMKAPWLYHSLFSIDGSLMRRILILALTIFCGIQAQGQTLTIEFSSEEDEIGQIYVQIMNIQGETVKELIIAYDQSPVITVVRELKPGSYAIRAFHDLNENGELDTSWLGLPEEPYGFSNNARGKFGPPDLEKQLFELSDQSIQKIHLH